MLLKISISSFSLAAAEFSDEIVQAKQGCQSKCGNVTIPYPFGIGNGCFKIDTDDKFNDDYINYRIICNTSYNPPKPFITASGNQLEVLSISDTEARIKNSFISFGCNSNSGLPVSFDYEDGYAALNLKNAPFTVSNTKNNVFGIGCGTDGVTFWTPDDSHSLNIERQYCQSSCEINEIMIESPCKSSGYMCCKTTIPKGLKIFDGSVWMPTAEGLGAPNSCRFALL
ncbi:hypothetical protein MKW94_029353, partial [Papaver nudicaule]|nr:hypothetical protein [Papaver nudicaule]